MGVKRHVKNLLKAVLTPVLNHYGYALIRDESLHELHQAKQIRTDLELPAGARDYLQPDHKRYQELLARYALFDTRVTSPLDWTDNYVKPDDMKYFRGDNAYIWQLRGAGMNVQGYVLATYYIKTRDTFGLLEKLKEDGQFGIVTFSIDNKVVSRDLLDSIMEIYFLEKHLQISSRTDLTILDIGAGYGRLADRMFNAFPHIRYYFCTDAVAASTFICEYYLAYRKIENKARVIPLDEIQNTLETEKVDIAVNIHSFSECKIAAIDWWLSLLEKNGIKYLMVVPNSRDQLLANGQDFQIIIEKHGYTLIAKEPKYLDPLVQKYAMSPDWYYLFVHK